MPEKLISKKKLKRDLKGFLTTIITRLPVNPVATKIIRMKILSMDRQVRKRMEMINQVYNI
jgi:hypothetical protein